MQRVFSCALAPSSAKAIAKQAELNFRQQNAPRLQ
jgi:hypothetical protein